MDYIITHYELTKLQSLLQLANDIMKSNKLDSEDKFDSIFGPKLKEQVLSIVPDLEWNCLDDDYESSCYAFIEALSDFIEAAIVTPG